MLERLAHRARQLADMPMQELRLLAPGVAVDWKLTDKELRARAEGKSRGELVELILLEEFADAFE